MTPTTDTDIDAVPIVCTLPPAELNGRQADIALIAQNALLWRRPIEHGALLRFTADADTERQLREIVAAEAECCAFLSMDLRYADDALELEVTGPDVARPIIEELFA
jgi:hypothetical protein